MGKKNRMKVALFAAVLLVSPQFTSAQSDFEKYMDGIRKSGMTEAAAGDLQAAAGILSGATMFEVKPTPEGAFQRSYSSALCFRPGADEQKTRALRDSILAKQQPWLALLKKHADTDASGFVSSDEGRAMRRRVELGLLVSQVADIKNVDDLVKRLREDRTQVVKDLAAYAKLQTESVKQKMQGLPALPKHLADAV